MKKKTNDYENFEKGMIYMKILKKGEEETKSMPHAPVLVSIYLYVNLILSELNSVAIVILHKMFTATQHIDDIHCPITEDRLHNYIPSL